MASTELGLLIWRSFLALLAQACMPLSGRLEPPPSVIFLPGLSLKTEFGLPIGSNSEDGLIATDVHSVIRCKNLQLASSSSAGSLLELGMRCLPGLV